MPADTSVKATSDRTVLAASYGVLDNVDVEMIFPMVRTAVSGDFNVTFRSIGTYQGYLYQQSIERSASGIGDIALRLKAWLPSSEVLDLAAGVEARLPTGDQEQLLGAGATQTRVSLITAANLGDVRPHANVGYTFAGDGIPDDIRRRAPYFVDYRPSNQFN